MLHCGMHMGYSDDRRFPDFTYISKTGKYTEMIDCVIISNFHLDHCRASQIPPICWRTCGKVVTDWKGDMNLYTAQELRNCTKTVIPVHFHETVKRIAGHVLGVGMFPVRVGNASVVYTGDYNSAPDRHLGPARIDKCRPDLLITETTYATTIRDSKRSRERDFLRKKFSFPYGLEVSGVFSAGMTEAANEYYKKWDKQKVHKTFAERNIFDFNHITSWEHGGVDDPHGMVLLANPGMLHAETSSQYGSLSFSHADVKGIMQLIDMCEPQNVRLVHGEKQTTELGIPCYDQPNGS
ncbi:beta-lactamase-like protein [Cladochytrium replicatum]|nr:beta-lactamase-like protein [Cladochytrium replicatum]